jgi:hypothetical protein
MKPLTLMICLLGIATLAFAGCDNNGAGSGSSNNTGTSPQDEVRILDATIPVQDAAAALLVELEAEGGTAPYTWELLYGSLPGNMVVTVAGDLAGWVGNYEGDFDFTVRVTDAHNNTAERDFTLTVSPHPPDQMYFGEPVTATRLFLVDISTTMAQVDAGQTQSRLEFVIDDIENQLSLLNYVNDDFDIIGMSGHGIENAFPEPQRATPRITAMALDYLNNATPYGYSPLYSAIRHAALDYGPNLARVSLYCGSAIYLDSGAPNGSSASASEILADFPGWWSNQVDAQFWTYYAGDGSGSVDNFLQYLAGLGDGMYFQLQ